MEGDESGETESEDEMATGDLMRVDSQVAEDEHLFTDWPESGLPFGYNTSLLHEAQGGINEAKKLKLRHADVLPAFQKPTPRSKGPIIPTLHLSACHLRLFNANSLYGPSIYCSELLRFQSPMYHATHPAIDRLNLTQYIPELGIIVIATQIGRAAICTLTRKGRRGPFGLRVDWILPLESQERSRERPLTHLLGIATSPVHGHHLPRSSRSVRADDQDSDDDDDDDDSSWLRDRTDAATGIATSFDPEVVRIRRNSDDASTSDSNTTTNPNLHHTRPHHRRRHWTSVRQPWPSRTDLPNDATDPIKDDAWRGIDHSRRYRLMLTYYDQSVMTYELARERPWVGDPGVGRANWRNRCGDGG